MSGEILLKTLKSTIGSLKRLNLLSPKYLLGFACFRAKRSPMPSVFSCSHPKQHHMSDRHQVQHFYHQQILFTAGTIIFSILSNTSCTKGNTFLFLNTSATTCQTCTNFNTSITKQYFPHSLTNTIFLSYPYQSTHTDTTFNKHITKNKHYACPNLVTRQ